MLNRLWVYKSFMILKYCNRWHPLQIQENNLNSPAGNRTLVSRVTGGDTHHYTSEDCLCWIGCEFINPLWFWSIVIDGILYKYRKIIWTPRQGIEPWSPAWQAGISPLYYRGLSMLNRLWVYKFFMILKYCNRWYPLLIQENKLNSPAGNRTLVSRVTGGDSHQHTTEDSLCWTGCEFINSLWIWSIVIDGILY